MAVSLTALQSITVTVSDANRSDLVTAQAPDQSYAKEGLTKSTGRVIDDVPIGEDDYSIPFGGMTTVKSFYLKMTDDTQDPITVKVSMADHDDQVLSGRLFAFQDCEITALKITKGTAAVPIEYILSGD